MEFLTDPEVWLAFLTLTVLEIVLGIDNIIFISVLTGRLPEADRARGRCWAGARDADADRAVAVADVGDEADGRPVHRIRTGDIRARHDPDPGRRVSIAKSTQEVHNSLEGMADEHNAAGTATFGSVLRRSA
jgi:hypothetical protein